MHFFILGKMVRWDAGRRAGQSALGMEKAERGLADVPNGVVTICHESFKRNDVYSNNKLLLSK